MKWVYITGPYTLGDPVENIQAMVYLAERVKDNGYMPIVPLLNHLWHLVSPHTREFFTEMRMGLLERCDAIYRMDGESKGADAEVLRMQEMEKPVFHSMRQLVQGMPSQMHIDAAPGTLRRSGL